MRLKILFNHCLQYTLAIIFLGSLAACSSISGEASGQSADANITGVSRRYEPLNPIETPPTSEKVKGLKKKTHDHLTTSGGMNSRGTMGAHTLSSMLSEQPKIPMTRPLINANKHLRWLRNGNIRFRKKFYRLDGAELKDRLRSLNQAKPHSAIWTCSDSRMPPEVLFDQKIDEIFVVRSLELQIDDSVVKAFEYATTEIKVPLLVILGSEFCGDAAPLGSMLLDSSQSLRQKREQGELLVVTAKYDPKTGKVIFN